MFGCGAERVQYTSESIWQAVSRGCAGSLCGFMGGHLLQNHLYVTPQYGKAPAQWLGVSWLSLHQHGLGCALLSRSGARGVLCAGPCCSPPLLVRQLPERVARVAKCPWSMSYAAVRAV